MRRLAVQVRPPAIILLMLIESVSGMRGIVGKDLLPDVIKDRVLRFAAFVGGRRFLLARDTRKSGRSIASIVKGVLTFYGMDVYDAGIIPTPTALLYIREKGFDGGFIITASHNPSEYNGIKFVTGEGLFPLEWDKKSYPEYKGATGYEFSVNDAIEYHIESVLKHFNGKKRLLRICVDTNGGAAYFALPELLRRMGHEVITINSEPSGIFVHNPEPRKEHLVELDYLLKSERCDLGFGTDPDADRLICGVKGIGVLSEEYTLPLALLGYGRRNSKVVVNYSTSMLSEFAAKKLGAEVVRTKVGEANVVNKMKEVGASLGGEGNGGVIFSHINSARDSLAGAFYVTLLAENQDIRDVVEQFPRYCLIKEKIELKKDVDLTALEKEFDADFVSREDGLYFKWSSAWLHVRRSNTEPIVRIYAEADSEDRARELVTKAISFIA